MIITSDLHHGIPGKLQDSIWAMDLISSVAKEKNEEDIIVLGDLFHNRLNLDVEAYSTVYDHLKKYRQIGQNWISFPGNHDIYLKNSWTINSLHPLKEIMTVHENQTTITIKDQKYHILPFISKEQEYIQQMIQIEEQANPDDILLTHIGVKGAKYNFCFLLQNWGKIDLEQTKFKRIYSGHFHCHQQVGTKLWYPGSPIPFRFDEGEVEHGFIHYHPKQNTHEFIKTFKQETQNRPPDYITIIDKDLEQNKEWIKGNKIRIILTQTYGTHELQEMKNDLETHGAIGIKWHQEKEDSSKINAQIKGLKGIKETFISWINQEETEGINKALILKLFDQITDEAEERFHNRERDEDD